MNFLFCIAAALVATASAAPTQDSPSDATAVSSQKAPVSDTVVVADIAADSMSVKPVGVCKNLPAGLEGVMIPDVAYTVKPALYCQNKACDFMNIWCEADGKKEGEFNFWYCCGNDCARTESMPKERKCEVEGHSYVVGKAYEVTLADGKCVTMWCTDETTHVTCSGSECGSTPELTPPGPTVCPVPAVPTPTIATEFPMPSPPPVYRNPECVRCIKAGNSFNVGTGECHNGLICPRDAVSKCIRNVHECPITPF